MTPRPPRSRTSGEALGGARIGGIGRLAADLESGRRLERHGDLLARAEMDCGYRPVVAGRPHRPRS